MSDRDVLIVDDNVAILRERARELEQEGYSVASYTFAKLEALGARGALFIQHLKLEAKILVDTRGRLRLFLARFQPRSDYSSELADNVRLAALAGTVCEGSKGALLAADILYVTVRNYGVLRLAERGIHRYAYDAILRVMEEEGLLQVGARPVLSQLRFLKCLYRAGEEVRGKRALETVSHALGLLPSEHFPAALKVESPTIILERAAPEEPAPVYLLLRDLEKRYVALSTTVRAQDMDRNLEDLSSWIRNPRAYAVISREVAPRLRGAMRNLIRRKLDRMPHIVSTGVIQ
jgi:hypothetical protein